MYTAARLVAAVLFCILGYFSATLVTDTFADGIQHTWFEPSIAAIGLWQGWMVMGRIAGRGYSAAVGNGLRTSVQIAFFGLVLYALREMFLRSADLRYNDFGRAVMDAMNLFIEYLYDFAAITDAWAILLAGGAVIGMATEAASRMWR